MAEGPKTGLGSAVAQAMAQAEPPPKAVQLPLMPAEELGDLSQDEAARKAQLRAPRKKGRPFGSGNRSTNDWRDYLLGRYPSPLIGLAEVISRNVRDLAAEADCTPYEALKVQVQAMAELAPYLHGKAPVEVRVGGVLPVLHLVSPEASSPAWTQDTQGRTVLDLAQLVPVQGNQSLIDATATVVEQQQSNGAQVMQPDQGDSASGALIGDQQQGAANDANR
jgi:hypothetical protein